MQHPTEKPACPSGCYFGHSKHRLFCVCDFYLGKVQHSLLDFEQVRGNDSAPLLTASVDAFL